MFRLPRVADFVIENDSESLSLTQARPDELEKILRRVTAINDRNTLRDCLIPLLVPERFLAGPSVNGDDLTLRPLSNLLFVLLRQHQVIPASMTKWFKSQLTLGHYLIGKDRAVVMEMLVDRIKIGSAKD